MKLSFMPVVMLCFIFMGVLPDPALALEAGKLEPGVRGGIMAGKKREYFHQYEVFMRYGLPWSWRTKDGWGLDTNIEGTAGALQGAAETGFIGSLGPGVSFNKTGSGASIDLGVTVDAISRHTFGRQDFGTPYLFGAYLGLSYRWNSGFMCEYRLLHLSNGHIFDPYSPNPGLDLHMLGIGWGF